MKNAINTFTRQATLFLLVFVFAVMSVSVGLSAQASTIDDTVNVYYFTDYDDSDFIDQAVADAHGELDKEIYLHRIDAYGCDVESTLDIFNNYADNHNIPENSYAIIELRTSMSYYTTYDYNDVHPECEKLNKLTDTLKAKGCKIMLIMGTHEYWLDCYNYYENTRFLDNVDIHINLDLFYVLCYSVLCDIEENGTYNSTIFINRYFSGNEFLRDWLLPYFIQYKYGEYSYQMQAYDDLAAQNISNDNNDFLSYLDSIADLNISILVEQSVGTYTAYVPQGYGDYYGYEQWTINPFGVENFYEMFGNNKCYAIGTRSDGGNWLTEYMMRSLRDADCYDVFDIFSYTGGYDDGYE